MSSNDNFFDYFQREMAYLRNEGARFASTFPKVANRLDFSNVESSDPHVERLLQSFAFLTARLQKDADDLFPRISTALLEALYPQFIAPLPSYAISKFDLADDTGKLTGRFRVPEGTQLYVHGNSGEICRFQTSMSLDLYPLTLKSVDIVSTLDLPKRLGKFETQRVLRLHVRSTAGPLNTLDLQKLRFHIAGSPILQNKLYEAIFLGDPQVGVSYGPLDEPVRFSRAQGDLVTPVGFAEEESVMPYPSHGHPGFRLLQEYFAYPQKFMFFDVEASGFGSNQKEAVFYISLHDTVSLENKDVDTSIIQLGCVPIVNLFRKISEPLRIDHKAVEYRLYGDHRRDSTTEIHSIQRVMGTQEGERDPIEFAPYFSYTHGEDDRDQGRFWHARRAFSADPKRPGNDTYLSFVDAEFKISSPASVSVYAEVLCTNRSLAQSMTAGTELQSDVSMPVKRIYCLDRPTPQRYMNHETLSQWRLISHLSLGHLSLMDNGVSLNMLRELLTQYGDFGDGNVIPEIAMVQDFQATRVTRRFGYEAWRGFAQGTKFTLTFSENISRDTNSFLFAHVLNHVLPQFASINSFTELDVTRAPFKGTWKQWQPRSGNNALV